MVTANLGQYLQMLDEQRRQRQEQEQGDEAGFNRAMAISRAVGDTADKFVQDPNAPAFDPNQPISGLSGEQFGNHTTPIRVSDFHARLANDQMQAQAKARQDALDQAASIHNDNMQQRQDALDESKRAHDQAEKDRQDRQDAQAKARQMALVNADPSLNADMRGAQHVSEHAGELGAFGDEASGLATKKMNAIEATRAARLAAIDSAGKDPGYKPGDYYNHGYNDPLPSDREGPPTPLPSEQEAYGAGKQKSLAQKTQETLNEKARQQGNVVAAADERRNRQLETDAARQQAVDDRKQAARDKHMTDLVDKASGRTLEQQSQLAETLLPNDPEAQKKARNAHPTQRYINDVLKGDDNSLLAEKALLSEDQPFDPRNPVLAKRAPELKAKADILKNKVVGTSDEAAFQSAWDDIKKEHVEKRLSKYGKVEPLEVARKIDAELAVRAAMRNGERDPAKLKEIARKAAGE